MMSQEQQVRETIQAHIRAVAVLLNRVQFMLAQRADDHDRSKLEPPEFETFVRVTPQLATLVYGSDEYKATLVDMGDGLRAHYKTNRHHPEHFPAGVDGMNLVDLIEMLCDWVVATSKTKDGDIDKSLDLNVIRFGIAPQLAQILRNTVQLL